jgi:DNA-binding NarL/FixJ family response regulator
VKQILIVDDHAIVREGLIRTLNDILEFPVQCDEASTACEAAEKINSAAYDLVLLDISLPDQNGLSLLKELKQDQPELPIVIVSTHSDEHYAVRSLRSGAAGYINKSCNSSILKEVIVNVLAGKRHISAVQSDLLVEAYSTTSKKTKIEKLSDREIQLMQMIAAGKTLTAIANELRLSVKTISSYRSRILEKLQLKTTADIISYCIHNKISA